MVIFTTHVAFTVLKNIHLIVRVVFTMQAPLKGGVFRAWQIRMARWHKIDNNLTFFISQQGGVLGG